MKCHLVLNPLSHGGQARGKLDSILQLLRQSGIDFECSYADGYDSIRTAAAAAHLGDDDAIVAIGGDGTINAVINGFFNEDGALRSDKMMGVIYTGTSPDFCKSYGIPLDHAQAVEALRNGSVRKIRLGRIKLANSPGADPDTTRYFSCCASIGVGAMVAEKANKYRKYLGDSAGTFAAILSSLAKFRAAELNIDLDGEKRDLHKVTNIFIGRTRYIASGLRVQAEIPDTDTRFYILCVHDLDAWRLPGLLGQLYSGNTVTSKVLEVSFGNQVRILSKQGPALIEFDGDPAGYTPCSIAVTGSQLNLIVAGS